MMNEEVQAEELLLRIAQKDVTALSELYDRYAPRVYGLTAHILPTREAAEEVLQQVFVRLWSESPSLSAEGGSVLAWLVITSRRVALEHLRTVRKDGDDGRNKAVKSPSAHGPGAPVTGAIPLAWLPQPKEIALIDERLDLLHKVVAQLPKPQQRALGLAVFEGLNESEIAVAIGEPLGKVRNSLRAAVTFLKHRRRAVCGTWAANI